METDHSSRRCPFHHRSICSRRNGSGRRSRARESALDEALWQHPSRHHPRRLYRCNLRCRRRSCSIRIKWAAVHCTRSEEHTSELQSLMRISYAVFCLKKKTQDSKNKQINTTHITRMHL